MGLLDAAGLGKVYLHDVYGLNPLLEGMGQRGMPVDAQARLTAIRALEQIRTELLARIQQAVPEAAKPIRVFKRPRADTVPRAIVGRHKVCPACAAIVRTSKHPCVRAGTLPVWTPYDATEYVQRQAFVVSPKGIKQYCRVCGLTLPKKFEKQTTDEVALRRLALRYDQDRVLPLLLAYREIDKILSTYTGRLGADGQLTGGLFVAADGCVHTTFTHDPSTLRLSSKAPNMQNLPREGPVRGMFRAPPGWTFWARDYRGIEAILVGYFAHSPRYQRLARLDIHTFFMAHALAEHRQLLRTDVPDEAWPDDQIAGALADLKRRFPQERQAYKPLVHGGNYLMGPAKAQDTLLQALGVVISKKAIQRAYAIYWTLFPEIPAWHLRVTGKAWAAARDFDPASVSEQEAAYQRTWLRTPFGNWHPFYEALRWEKHHGWEAVWGADTKRCVAFLPSSSARFILTRAAQRLAPNVQETLRLFIHDELLGLCREEDVEPCLINSQHEMEQPIPELGGLTFPTEAKVGPCWGTMTSWMT